MRPYAEFSLPTTLPHQGLPLETICQPLFRPQPYQGSRSAPPHQLATLLPISGTRITLRSICRCRPECSAPRLDPIRVSCSPRRAGMEASHRTTCFTRCNWVRHIHGDSPRSSSIRLRGFSHNTMLFHLISLRSNSLLAQALAPLISKTCWQRSLQAYQGDRLDVIDMFVDILGTYVKSSFICKRILQCFLVYTMLPLKEYFSLLPYLSLLLIANFVVLPRSASWLGSNTSQRVSQDRPEHPFLTPITSDPLLTMACEVAGTAFVIAWWSTRIRRWWFPPVRDAQVGESELLARQSRDQVQFKVSAKVIILSTATWP
jgi:hypothetical protein